MKLNMRKVLAVLAALATLCAVLPLGSMFSAMADDTNLIANGDFSAGIDGWYASGGTAIEAADGTLHGDYNEDWGFIGYNVNVKPNTDYTLTFDGKSINGGGVTPKMNKTDWTGTVVEQPMEFGAEWQTFTWDFNSGDYNAFMLFFQSSHPAGDGQEIWLDNISLVEKAGGDEPEVPANDNLIVNGDFETGDNSGWEIWQSTSISADAAKDGAFGAHLVGNGSWGGMLNQTVAVEAGKQYKLSFWINVNAMGVNVQVKDGAGNGIEGAGGWFDANNKDKLVEWTFTAPDNSVFINFCGSGSAPEDVYVDNFSLICLDNGGDAPAQPSNDGYIINGDFETGDIKPWDNLWGSCPTAEVIEGGKDSKYALNIVSGQWKHVRQTGIAVEANTDYKVTAWAKDAANMSLLVKDGGDSKDIVNAGVNAGSEWTKFTAEFNTGDYTTIIFSLMGSDVTAYGVFDNIVIEKIGGETPDTPDTPDEPDEPVTPPTGGLLNATFDGGETDGVLSSSDISVADGELQFNVTKDWGNVYAELAVEANTDYEVSFRAKSKLGKNFWVKFHKADWTGDIVQADVSISKEWKEYTFTLNSGNNTSLWLLIQYAGYAAEGEIAWFDYITVKKAGSDEPDVPADGILSEDFEGALPEDWTISSGSGLSGIVDGAFKLEGDAWGEVLTSKQFAIKDGVTYTVDFDLKVLAKGEVNFQIKNCPEGKPGTGNNIILEYITDGVVGEWKHYTYTFQKGEFINDYASLLFVVTSGVDFYVDNIVVTSDEQPEIPDEPASGIVNGSFEDGFEGWELGSSASITDEDAHTGNASLKLENPGMWAAAAVQNVPVKPNTEYVIKMWVKRIDKTQPFNLYLMDAADNRNLEIVSGQNWFNTNDTEWTEKTIVINTGAATEIIIKWSSETSNAGILLVDDMTIAEKNAPPAPSAGLVINGDFETGDATGWETWQSTVVSEEAAHGGKYGVNLIGDGGWGGMLNQTFKVENGEAYTITLWVCVNASGANLQINGADKVEEECDNTYLDSKELSGWTLRTFNVIANSDEMTLNFCGGGTKKAEDLYIDDIVVVKKGETPAVDETSPIKNAGFETGELHSNTTPGGVTGAWYNVWGACTYSFETKGYNGSNYALNYSAPGQWQQIRQDMIPVEPNTDYVVVGYVKNPMNVNIVVKHGDDSDNVNEVAIENDFSNKWVRAAVEFNSGDLNAICVLLISREAGASAIWDDVQVYVKGTEPTDVINDEEVTEGPTQLDSFGVAINRPASPEANLIQNGSFEDAEGGQWQSILGDTLYVVDDETAPEGNKSLFFNTSGVTENNKHIFYMDVEPNTDYVFSAWVKGAFISDDNRFNATFGTTDWKDNFMVYSDAQFSNKSRQIVPTAWDNEWHLRAVQFNSGVNKKIGIGFAGAESQMWIDGIALYTVEDGVKYADARQTYYIIGSPLEDAEAGTCTDENNLIANATMDSAAAQEFWAGAEGFKNGFISFPENQYEYGTSMKYTGDDKSCYTNAIKWLEVEPNTDYIFTVDIRVVKTGGGSLNLLDGKKRDCNEFFMFDFDQYTAGTDWNSVAFTFNSGEFDRIGISVVDGGGEALIDNMRLFKAADRIDGGKDDYVKPPYSFDDPEDPENPGSPDTGVSVMGAVLAVALVPSSAAVAFKLRRKKEDKE